MQKVVVTGGMGYLGSTLVPDLVREGYDVTVVDNFYYNQFKVLDLMPCEFKLIQKDCREYNDWWKYDIVIPLAAYVGVGRCNIVGEEETWNLNYNFIEHLCKKLNKDQQLIYLNTNSSYGTSKDAICVETSERNPLSSYAASKDKAEDIALSRLNSVVYRLATVCGISPRMRFDLLVNNLCELAYKNGRLDIFEPQFRRNFVSVKDVSRAIQFGLAMFGFMKQDVFNLGNDGANCDKGSLAKMICSEFQAEYCETTGNDSDRRDYNVSSQKLYNVGYKCQDSLVWTVNQIKGWLNSNKIQFWMKNS